MEKLLRCKTFFLFFSINMNGDVKSMHLSMTGDLLKISAKKTNSKLPPKPKYVIDTAQIKQIIKGHGTEAFKKSKGFFRSSNDFINF